MTKWLLVAVLLAMGARNVHAEKLASSWTPPTLNADGSVLTNLSGYRVEWGECTTKGAWGTYQAGINVGAPAVSTPIYPTGLTWVCVRVYSINTDNILSLTPSYATHWIQ